MASVAVGIGMNPHQLVVKARGDFIGRVGFVVDPVAAIIDELSQFGGDAVGIDADILVAVAVIFR